MSSFLIRAGLIKKNMLTPSKSKKSIFGERGYADWQWPSVKSPNILVSPKVGCSPIHDCRMSLQEFLSPNFGLNNILEQNNDDNSNENIERQLSRLDESAVNAVAVVNSNVDVGNITTIHGKMNTSESNMDATQFYEKVTATYSKDGEINTLRNEVHSLQEKLSLLQTSYDQMAEVCNAHSSRGRLLTETVSTMEEQHLNLEMNLAIAENNLLDNQSMYDSMNKENIYLKNILAGTSRALLAWENDNFGAEVLNLKALSTRLRCVLDGLKTSQQHEQAHLSLNEVTDCQHEQFREVENMSVHFNNEFCHSTSITFDRHSATSYVADKVYKDWAKAQEEHARLKHEVESLRHTVSVLKAAEFENVGEMQCLQGALSDLETSASLARASSEKVSALELLVAEKEAAVSKLHGDNASQRAHISDLERAIEKHEVDMEAYIADLTSSSASREKDLEYELRRKDARLEEMSLENAGRHDSLMDSKVCEISVVMEELEVVQELAAKSCEIVRLEAALGRARYRIESDLADLNEVYSTLAADHAERKAAVMKLESSLGQAKLKVEQLEEALSSKDEELERALSSKDKELEHLVGEKADLERQLSESKELHSGQLREQSKEVAALVSDIERLRERESEVLKEKREVESDLADLNEVYSTLAADHAERKAAVMKLESSLGQAKLKVEQLEEALSSKDEELERALSSKDKELEHLVGEKADLEMQLSESKELHSGQLREQSKEVAALVSDIERLRERESEVLKEKREVESDLADLNEVYSTLAADHAERKAAVMKLESSLGQAKLKVEQLEEALSSKDEELERALSSKDKELEHLVGEKADLEMQLSESKELHSGQLREQSKEVAALVSDIERLRERESEVLKEKREVESDLADLNEVYSTLAADHAERKAAVMKLESSLGQAKLKVEQLEEALSSKDEELERALSSKDKELEHLVGEKADLERQLSESKELHSGQLREQSKEVAALVSDIERLRERESEVLKEKREVESDLADLNEVYSTLAADYAERKAAVVKLESSLGQAKLKVEQLEEALSSKDEELERALSSKDKELEHLVGEKADLEMQLSESKELHSGQLREQSKEVAALVSDIERLRERESEVLKEKREVESDLADLNEVYSTLAAGYAERKAAVVKLESSLGQAKLKVEQLEEALSSKDEELERALSSKDKELEHLVGEKADLERQLSESKELHSGQLREQSKEVAALVSDIERLRERESEVLKEKREVESDLADLNEVYSTLAAGYAERKAAVMKLESSLGQAKLKVEQLEEALSSKDEELERALSSKDKELEHLVGEKADLEMQLSESKELHSGQLREQSKEVAALVSDIERLRERESEVLKEKREVESDLADLNEVYSTLAADHAERKAAVMKLESSLGQAKLKVEQLEEALSSKDEELERALSSKDKELEHLVGEKADLEMQLSESKELHSGQLREQSKEVAALVSDIERLRERESEVLKEKREVESDLADLNEVYSTLAADHAERKAAVMKLESSLGQAKLKVEQLEEALSSKDEELERALSSKDKELEHLVGEKADLERQLSESKELHSGQLREQSKEVAALVSDIERLRERESEVLKEKREVESDLADLNEVYSTLAADYAERKAAVVKLESSLGQAKLKVEQLEEALSSKDEELERALSSKDKELEHLVGEKADLEMQLSESKELHSGQLREQSKEVAALVSDIERLRERESEVLKEKREVESDLADLNEVYSTLAADHAERKAAVMKLESSLGQAKLKVEQLEEALSSKDEELERALSSKDKELEHLVGEKADLERQLSESKELHSGQLREQSKEVAALVSDIERLRERESEVLKEKREVESDLADLNEVYSTLAADYAERKAAVVKLESSLGQAKLKVEQLEEALSSKDEELERALSSKDKELEHLVGEKADLEMQLSESKELHSGQLREQSKEVAALVSDIERLRERESEVLKEKREVESDLADLNEVYSTLAAGYAERKAAVVKLESSLGQAKLKVEQLEEALSSKDEELERALSYKDKELEHLVGEKADLEMQLSESKELHSGQLREQSKEVAALVSDIERLRERESEVLKEKREVESDLADLNEVYSTLAADHAERKAAVMKLESSLGQAKLKVEQLEEALSSKDEELERALSSKDKELEHLVGEKADLEMQLSESKELHSGQLREQSKEVAALVSDIERLRERESEVLKEKREVESDLADLNEVYSTLAAGHAERKAAVMKLESSLGQAKLKVEQLEEALSSKDEELERALSSKDKELEHLVGEKADLEMQLSESKELHSGQLREQSKEVAALVSDIERLRERESEVLKEKREVESDLADLNEVYSTLAADHAERKAAVMKLESSLGQAKLKVEQLEEALSSKDEELERALSSKDKELEHLVGEKADLESNIERLRERESEVLKEKREVESDLADLNEVYSTLAADHAERKAAVMKLESSLGQAKLKVEQLEEALSSKDEELERALSSKDKELEHLVGEKADLESDIERLRERESEVLKEKREVESDLADLNEVYSTLAADHAERKAAVMKLESSLGQAKLKVEQLEEALSSKDEELERALSSKDKELEHLVGEKADLESDIERLRERESEVLKEKREVESDLADLNEVYSTLAADHAERKAAVMKLESSLGQAKLKVEQLEEALSSKDEELERALSSKDKELEHLVGEKADLEMQLSESKELHSGQLREQSKEVAALVSDIERLRERESEVLKEKREVESDLADLNEVYSTLAAGHAERKAAVMKLESSLGQAKLKVEQLEEALSSKDEELERALSSKDKELEHLVGEKADLESDIERLRERESEVLKEKREVESDLADLNEVYSTLAADNAERKAAVMKLESSLGQAKLKVEQLEEALSSKDEELERALSSKDKELEHLVGEKADLEMQLSESKELHSGQLREQSKEVAALVSDIERLRERESEVLKEKREVESDLADLNEVYSTLAADHAERKAAVMKLESSLGQAKLKVEQLEEALSSKDEELERALSSKDKELEHLVGEKADLEMQLSESKELHSGQLREQSKEVAALVSDIERLRERESEVLKEKREVESDLADLNEVYSTLAADHAERKAAVMKLESSLGQAKLKVEQLEEALSSKDEELERALSSKDKELEHLVGEKADLEMQLSESKELHSGQLREQSKEVAALVSDIERLRERESEVLKEKREVESDLADLNEVYSTLAADHAERKAAVMKLESSLGQAKLKVEQLEEALSSKDEELERALSSKDKELEHLVGEKADLESDIERLRERESEVLKEKREVESDLADLNEVYSTLAADHAERKAAVMKLESSLGQAKLKVEQLEEALSSKDEELERALSSKDKELEHLVGEKADLEMQLSESKELHSGQLREQSKEVAALVSDIERLRERESEVLKEKREVESDLADLNEVYSTLAADYAERKAAVMKLESSLGQAKLKVEQLEEALLSKDEELERALSSKDKELEHLVGEKADLESDIERLRERESEVLKEKREVESDLADLNEVYSTLAADHAERKAAVMKLESSLGQAKLKVEQLEEALSSKDEELERALSSKDKELEHLVGEKADLERQLSESKELHSGQLREQSKEVAALVSDIERLRERESEVLKEKREVESDLADLNEVYSTLAADYAERKAAVMKLESSLGQAKLKVEQLEEALLSKDEELERALSSKDKELEHLVGEKADLESDIERLRERESEVLKEKTEVESDLADLNEVYSTLAADHAERKAAVMKLESSLGQAKLKVEQLEEALSSKDEELERALSSKDKELEHLVGEKADLERQLSESKELHSGQLREQSEEIGQPKSFNVCRDSCSLKDGVGEQGQLSDEVARLEGELDKAVEEVQCFESALFELESSMVVQIAKLREKEIECRSFMKEISALKLKNDELEKENRTLAITRSLDGQPLDVQLKTLSLVAAEKSDLDSSDVDESSLSSISSDDSGFVND